MKSSVLQIEHLLRTEGLVVAAEHPELRGTIGWLHRSGRLARILPGVYVAVAAVDRTDLLIAAVARTVPSAVLTGASAARVAFWPEFDVTTVTAAVPYHRDDHPRVSFNRRRIPSALVWHLAPDPHAPWLPAGLRCTSPALTAWDLTGELGGEAIDEVLRRRGANLTELAEALALTPGRRGNVERRRLLLDSRAEPWSQAERRAHRILRQAGISGWRANHPARAGGRRYHLDLAWPDCKLAVEIDGRRWHSDPEVFESDRRRQNDLVADGWTVLRLTWAMLDDEDEVVRLVRRLLRRLQLTTGHRSMAQAAPIGRPKRSSGARW